MTDSDNLRKIPFDSQDNIIEAIREHENFEVVGCGSGNMSDAVKWMEKAIESNGLTCRIYTKERKAALTGLAIPTYDPDYEIMKRPIDNALLVTYVKTPSKIAQYASHAAGSIAEAWEKHVPTKDEIVKAASSTAKKIATTTSETKDSIAEAWDKHAPSKESVIGAVVVGGMGSLVLNKEELENVGAKTIAAASKAASTVSDAVVTAATVVKENPGATITGAVVGVGAIAAAPFTGGGSVVAGTTLASSLAGAGTVVTAIGAGATCAGAGAAMSNEQTKKIKKNAYNDGIKRGKAESYTIIEDLKKKIELAANAYSTQALRDDFIASLAAIGFSIAACDGPISDEEKTSVEEYVLGASKFQLPKGMRDCLHSIANAPPDFEGAILYVQNFDKDIWQYIDDLLEVVAEADGDINQSEQEFLDKWENYKISTQKGGIA